MRRFVISAIGALAVCLFAALSGVGTATASPKGNDNWTVLDATCDGIGHVQLLDPPGGNTSFLPGGSVGVGKRFRWTNLATGEVLMETVKGRGVDEDRLTHCSVILYDVPTPGGTLDVLFEIWGLVTPQGG